MHAICNKWETLNTIRVMLPGFSPNKVFTHTDGHLHISGHLNHPIAGCTALCQDHQPTHHLMDWKANMDEIDPTKPNLSLETIASHVTNESYSLNECCMDGVIIQDTVVNQVHCIPLCRALKNVT